MLAVFSKSVLLLKNIAEREHGFSAIKIKILLRTPLRIKIFPSSIQTAMPKKQTEWIQLVKKTYAKGKKANSNYKFSTALKDAKKSYKKK